VRPVAFAWSTCSPSRSVIVAMQFDLPSFQ
jgi:hypothetical protein